MSELKNQELPPLDDTQEERDRSLAMMPNNRIAALYRAMCDCRERQLLAALNELKAKDTELAALKVRFRTAMDNLNGSEDSRAKMRTEINTLRGKLEDAGTELAAKDARIAELTRGPEFYAYTRGAISDTRIEGMIDETRWWKVPGDEVYEVVRELKDLRSRLGAVSEVMKETLEPVSLGPDWPDVYSKAEVDARDARLRSIVEGK